MRKQLLWASILSVSLLGVPAVAAEPAPPCNVILIGWDGAQRNHVNECLERKELPNLQKLIDAGVKVDIDVHYGATDTKAGWAQILTGYKPEITGIYSNGKYQPIPEGYTIFERLRKQFGPSAIATVAVIGKARHVGDFNAPVKKRLDDAEKKPQPAAGKAKKAKQPGAGKAPAGTIVEEDGVKYRVIPGAPYYHTQKNVDVWESGLMLDEKVGGRAIQLLEQYKDRPLFFFVHFAEVDHKGHKFGENSKEYNDALISNDAWTGKVLEKLRELGLPDKTLVYVTADHGFDEGKTSHKKAPHIFLVSNDKGVLRGGDRIDVAATILRQFGLALEKIEPPLSGAPLTQPAEAAVTQPTK